PSGDTFGFYAGAREFISAWAHTSRPLLGAASVVLIVALAVANRLRQAGRLPEAIALASVAVGAFTALGIRAMVSTGAGAIGWPIVWSIPMFPLRATGLLSYHVAFYAGIAILLVCNVVAIVATAAIVRRVVPGRAALVAPALLVAWPFIMRGIQGGGNVVYGSWLDDAGLILYSEPLSTALVTSALALIVLRQHDAAA